MKPAVFVQKKKPLKPMRKRIIVKYIPEPPTLPKRIVTLTEKSFKVTAPPPQKNPYLRNDLKLEITQEDIDAAKMEIKGA